MAGDRLDLARAEGVFKMRMHGAAQHPNHVYATLSSQFFLEKDTFVLLIVKRVSLTFLLFYFCEMMIFATPFSFKFIMILDRIISRFIPNHLYQFINFFY